MVRSCLLYALALAVLAAPIGLLESRGAKVKVWDARGPAAYDKAQLKGVVVSSEGVLRLGRGLKPLAALDCAHVWDLVEAKNGDLFAAAGDEGKVFKVTPDGKATVVYSNEEARIFCLAPAGDDAVYAGGGPHGQILRIDAKGGVKVVGETGEPYVWGLAADPKTRTLYATTGPHGRIYRIGADGKADVLYTAKQEHVLCLAVGADGTVYAGTDKNGLVYRIDPKGKAFVLMQAAQSEVRCLRLDGDAVYVGTSAPTKRRGPAVSAAAPAGAGTASLDKSSDAASVSAAKEKASGDEAASKVGGAEASEVKETPKGSSASAPSVPGGGENSVYRIGLDGAVREVFREKAMVLSLLKEGGRLLVGSGMDGQLFEVDEGGRERAELARLDHGQVMCLCRRRDGSVVLGAGDPGKLYVLQDHYADRGAVISDVMDAKMISRWGAVRWQADAPEKTSVTVCVRSGNVAEPDETWSDWSAEQADPAKAVAAAPAARFLQYRVTMTTDDPTATPAVRGLTVRYQTVNQAPEVTKIEAPDLNAVNLETPKKLRFKWTAQDANEDELTYSLFVRKEGWKNWAAVEEDFDKTEYEWDSTAMPDGVYQLKVVASDRRDNPDGEALTGERVGVPFVVCHTPPTVTLKVVGLDGDRAVVEATAASALVRLTAASFTLNGKKPVNVFPDDGLFDDKTETFKFKTDALKPGTYVLVLRVRDAAGNTGSGDATFTVEARPGK
jgi:hypothetical protein